MFNAPSPFTRACLAAVLGVACAPRALPGRFPTSSAASTEAAEPAAPAVAVALSEDPPLPGEDTARWRGLAPEAGESAPNPHAHHHGMVQGDAAPRTAPQSDAGTSAAPHQGHDHAH